MGTSTMILTSKPEIPRRDEEPQTNAQNAYVATPLEFEIADSRFKSHGQYLSVRGPFANAGKTTSIRVFQ
jgi:hypothetical protein